MDEREMFDRYEKVRLSGKINMFDRSRGCALSGLIQDEYTWVIKNYSELAKKYKKKGD